MSDSGRGRAYYWGLHLDERSRRSTPTRPVGLPEFSVQRLAPGGGPTEDIAYFDDASDALTLAGQDVAKQVLLIIQALPEGSGIYLTREGLTVEPF